MENQKTSQNMIRKLIQDTLILLCKNTISFNTELNIEGLIGLTVDKNEIILVSIRENFDKNLHDFRSPNINEVEPINEIVNFTPSTGEKLPSSQAKIKRKRRKVSQTFADKYHENVNLRQLNDGCELPPTSNQNEGESSRTRADFNFERVEVKQEENENVDSYGNYIPSGNKLTSEDGQRTVEFNMREQAGCGDTSQRQPVEYDDDCFLVDPGANELIQPQYSAMHPNNFQDVSNNLDILEQNVDSFMSVDQKIFQEMFRADFASSGSLAFNVEGTTGDVEQRDSNTNHKSRRNRRQRSNLKADTNFSNRSLGLIRRGYRFHSRYGYSRILHQCPQCSATFTMASNLGRHMATMHNENGDGLCTFCPICQKRFSRSDNLARHLKQVHKCDSQLMPSLTSLSPTVA